MTLVIILTILGVDIAIFSEIKLSLQSKEKTLKK